MKIKLFKKLFICFFIIWVILMFSTCDRWITWNIIEISGTVTITRNGEPWIHDALIDNIKAETSARMQAPLPPYDRPAIRAFTSPGGKSIGSNYNFRQPPLNNDDLTFGKYTWTVELINVVNVPKIIFFEIEVPMAGLWPNKMTQGIKIGENLSAIDLGVINFDVVRLWGNLPVTINGESLEERSVYLDIRKDDGSYFINRTIGISLDGNWMQDVYAQNLKIPVTFNLTANKNRAVFKKILNSYYDIYIHNVDKEIVFPDYPYIDFEAFSLSGTVEILISDATRYWIEINFYETNDLQNSLIGSAVNQPPKVNESGLIEWETLLPAFSFPKTLFLVINTPVYKTNSSILITEDMDLNNIFLGSFPY